MTSLRAASLIILIACVATGCQSGALEGTVAEYRPSAHPVETKAADPGVFVLWRWAPTATDASTRPTNTAENRPIEVRQDYVDKGLPIGFVRNNGQLIGVAGPTTMPLEDGHYAWTALTATNAKRDTDSNARGFWVAWWYWTSTPWSFALGSPNVDPQR